MASILPTRAVLSGEDKIPDFEFTTKTARFTGVLVLGFILDKENLEA
jgi:hypothetical protein